MRKLWSAVLAGALLLLPSAAFADSAGTAQGVAQSAAAVAKGETRTLLVGADVFIGDLVQTGPKGDVQILFADNTRLVVGPGSSLKIEDYLLRNNGDAGTFLVDLLSGAFRFFTGDSPKDKYELQTPNGTIGVRGTIYDVSVLKTTRVMMYRGTTRLCSLTRQCVDLTGQCEVGEFTVNSAQILGDARTIGGAEHTNLRRQFIYAVNQSPLLRTFWAPGALDCLNRPPVVNIQPPDTSTPHQNDPQPPSDG